MKCLNKKHIAALAAIMAVGVLLICCIGWRNDYNSYALQAQRWLQGGLDLGENYSHLEIAAFGGKYYISFPPFPSMVLMPFVLLFGTATPDHLLCLLATLLGFFYAVKIAARFQKNSALYPLLLILASNYMLVAFCGWVWFMAQAFAFVLSLMAIYYAVDEVPQHGWLSLLFWAMSVGCRPLQAVYAPLLLYLLYKKCRPQAKTVGGVVKKYWYFAVGPVVLAAVYMALNYARFGNPLEFGHNYLPEFLKEPQFGAGYLLQNMKNLFRMPFQNGEFVRFNGFAFYMVSPLFISGAVYGIRNFIKGRKDVAFHVLLWCLIALHFLLLCSHRTMGGWQFGNRYTVDALPFAYLGLVTLADNSRLRYLDYALCAAGICVNLAGSVLFFTGMI